MDILGVIRTLGSLAIILGMLAGGLWAVRRFDICLPGRTGGGQERRLELVERIGIDQRRSLIIVRRDDREHLMAVGPEGCVTIESFDSRSAPRKPREHRVPQTSQKFAALVKDVVAGPPDAKRSSRAGSTRRKS